MDAARRTGWRFSLDTHVSAGRASDEIAFHLSAQLFTHDRVVITLAVAAVRTRQQAYS